MGELVLLWAAFGSTVVLAVTRRDRAGLPWVGMGLAVAGILTLVVHASRRQLTAYLASEFPASPLALGTRWQLIEMLGLLLVGAGVVVMSLVADRERRSRKVSAQLASLAPQVHGSREVLRSVLASAPGAWLLLTGHDTGELHIVHADDRARSLLRVPTNGVTELRRHGPEGLARAITQAARSSECERGAGRVECAVEDRWYQIAAGVHGDAVIVLLDDITARKQAEARLQRAAFVDPVTGLANRVLFERQLDEHLARVRDVPGYTFALLCIDFDNFKRVNDQHGHTFGDGLLRSIGARIEGAIGGGPAPDSYDRFGARWGGDEFVVIVGGVGREQAGAVARELHAALASPHRVEGVEIRSTASIGVVISAGQHATGVQVLADADDAMYVAKREGKNAIRFHTESMIGPVPYAAESEGRGDREERPRAA